MTRPRTSRVARRRAAIALSLAVTAAALGCASRSATQRRVAGAGDLPADGTALLARMHDAYATRWYRTLTFVQRTTQRRPDGTTNVSIWYESVREPDRLRIDVAPLSNGNGVLYTADSAYRVRGGRVVSAAADGNPFLPFVEGVYRQPVAATLRQLAPYRFDMSRVRRGGWEGRPVFVVGAADSADLASPQFWVDAERLVLVRMFVALVPNGKARTQDVRMGGYVPVGDAWLATRVEMLDGGVPLQTEEYTDWHADVDLPARFFQAEHWTEGAHWAAGRTDR